MLERKSTAMPSHVSRTTAARCSAWRKTPWRNGGRPARASARPACHPRKMAIAGWKRNRSFPGPARRFGRSSKNRIEKR